MQPAYDFPSNFERIYNTVKSGGYANEYAFGFDLYEAVSTVPMCYNFACVGAWAVVPLSDVRKRNDIIEAGTMQGFQIPTQSATQTTRGFRRV